MPHALVCLPGLLCTPAVWAASAELLGRDVTLPSIPADDSIPRIAATLLSGLPERFVLAGFSMGGYIAFEILRQAPDRVVGLALFSTTAAPDSEEQKAGRAVAAERARAQGMDAFAGKLARFLLGPDHAGNERLTNEVVAMAVETGVETFAMHQHAIAARRDSRDLLAGIDFPVVVAAGDQDKVIPPQAQETLAGAIGTASLELVPGCGHMLPLEAPGAVASSLAALLDAVAAPATPRKRANA